jgi:hypothetical protein
MSRFIGFLAIFAACLLPVVVHGDVGTTGRARLALSVEGAAQFSGETVSKDFYVRLPGHVYPRAGSEFTVSLRTQPTLLSLVEGIELQVNGKTVSTTSLDGLNPSQATNAPLRVVASVPAQNLQAGGNRLTLHFLFRNTAAANQDVLKSTMWSFDAPESAFTLAFERAELFPEMRRFPESLAEEKLLKPDAAPLLTLLLPERMRDAHLRGCAVVGTRLGQVNYFADLDCLLLPIVAWSGEFQARSGVVVGCREELAGVELPSRILTALKELRAGQGLLAEFIVGEPGSQRRWLVASGADDLGLERAVLTLGHASAMGALPSNPAIIETEPAVDPESRQSMTSHASLWTQWQSFLSTAAMRITGAISGSESKEAQPVASGKPSLQRLHQILASDGSLQHTAFLLPKSASLEEAKLLFDLARYLGGELPHSTVLWPEACTFSRSSPPSPARVANRTVLLLAPVAEWGNAFSTPLALEVPPQVGRVRIQGRLHPMSQFEPTLGFVHLMPSPWSKGEQVVAAGGWQEVSPVAVKDLIERAAPAGKLAGDLCAADVRGRIAVYDTRHPKLESFVQILQRHIPEGLTENETQRQVEAAALRAERSSHFNRRISYVVGGAMLLLVFVRFLLLWNREWRRRRKVRDDKLLPGPSLEMTNIP